MNACDNRNLISNCFLIATSIKHRHAKRAGVIFSIDWVAWGKAGC